MSDVQTFQAKLLLAFTNSETYTEFITTVIQLLNDTFSSTFSLSVSLGNNACVETTTQDPFQDQIELSDTKQFSCLLRTTSQFPSDELFEQAKAVIAKRTRLEFDKVDTAVETTARILGITFHDVRNTLGSISGIAQLMELDADNNQELLTSIHDVINIIKKFDVDSAVSMRLLRGQELTYSSDDFDFSEMAEAILKRNSRVYQLSSIEVESSIEPNIMISGDKELHHELMTELLVNAASALEGNGGKITVNIKKSDGKVKIAVEHDGEPIKTGTREYIFTPFYTTKDKGRGMGLTKLARYISDWGGTIEYATSIDVPVSFVVQLPITL